MPKFFLTLTTAVVVFAIQCRAQKDCDSLFSAADNAYKQDSANAAIMLYTRIISLNCGYLSKTYNNRGFLYNELEQYTTAIEDFEKVLKIDPTNSSAYANECTSYNLLGNHTAARIQIEKAIKLSPSYYLYYKLRGDVKYSEEKYDSAILDFKKSISLNSAYVKAYTLIAGIYEDDLKDAGHLDSAEAILTQLVENNTDNHLLIFKRAEFYRRTGANDKAIDDYLQGLKAGSADFEMLCNLAFCYDGKGDWKNAVEFYTKSINAKPNSIAYVNRGRIYKKTNKIDLAIADEENAVLLDSTYSQAYLILGNCYLLMNDTASAAANYKKGLAQGPEGQIKSLLIRQLSNIDPQFTAIDLEFTVPKGCDSAAFYKALEFHQNGQFGEAIEKYSEQIKGCPIFYEAYINRGFCYYNQNKRDEAHRDFETAAKVSTDKAKTLFSIADIFFNVDIYDTAFTMFKAVANLNPNNSAAYFKMGRCKWLARIRILQANKVDDYATDTAFKTHLHSEILSYYDKAIYLDSIENGAFYAKRGKNSMDAFMDINTNYEYYYFRGLFKANFYDYAGALVDYEKSISIHPTIDAYNYAAGLAKLVGQNEKACDYKQQWATMMNPLENIDVFKKHEIADKFCKELGVNKK